MTMNCLGISLLIHCPSHMQKENTFRYYCQADKPLGGKRQRHHHWHKQTLCAQAITAF